MKTEVTFKYNEKEKEYTIQGYPQLEGKSGIGMGEGMVVFFGRGWRNYEFFVANTITGKIRQLGTEGGSVLVNDNEIDYEAVRQGCENGSGNAFSKCLCYASLNRYDGFEKGLCAISWTLYPDGRYFADEDGFGMEDNDEEVIYGIINTDLEFVEPFRPVANIKEHLKELRNKRK